MISPDSPIVAVLGDPGSRGAAAPGVSSKSAATKHKAFAEGLGLQTVGDLLRHFPRRYVETAELTRVDELEVGQFLTVVGQIAGAQAKSYSDRRTGRLAYRTEVTLATDGPDLGMTFFAKQRNVAEWHKSTFGPGRRGLFYGTVGQFRGQWQLANPKYVLFGGAGDDELEAQELLSNVRGLFPIYPLTKGLETLDVQRVVDFARSVVDDVPELLPAACRRGRSLPTVTEALELVHAPDSRGQVATGQRYFRFEEALITQCVLARRRRAVRDLGTRERTGGGGLLAAFDQRLPFELTEGQASIGAEIEADLARSYPMNRLLQGEVGSGKTVVALRAMVRVVDSGGQAALLAPTEVLAAQHYRTVLALMGDLAAGGLLGGADEATRVRLLTGSMGKKARGEAMLDITSGEAGIVIGTHALLQENVGFADLGLVVVDEQHRFGVEQRAALTEKAGHPPHVLVMTATPIPRTVAMTVFGDLEVSTLRELPRGRGTIQTTVVPIAEQPSWLGRAWQRIAEEVQAGHQAYVVCPRISKGVGEDGPDDVIAYDEDGNQVVIGDEATSVEQLAEELDQTELAGLRIGRLHGRLPADEKDATMRSFARGEIDVLVTTTVIEVGVDVPNATVMVVMNADRFGISQLHQLRGRVGRGGLPGLCLLVSRAETGAPARIRLDAVASTTDGFELARADLEQRREGDVLGASQAGFRSSLQALRVLRDEDTIVAAREDAETLVEQDASLATWPELAGAVLGLEASVESAFMDKS